MQGGKRKGAASGESAAKYFYYFFKVFAADSPLASVHIIYLFLLIFLLVMTELLQWQVGPLSDTEAKSGIPPLNPPSRFCSYESADAQGTKCTQPIFSSGYCIV